ncbi:DUF3108 domain-containing protein [Thermodesulfobacteriota bacterium]
MHHQPQPDDLLFHHLMKQQSSCSTQSPVILLIALLLVFLPNLEVHASPVDDSAPASPLMATANPDKERLKYNVSWLGMNAGLLSMRIEPAPNNPGDFFIKTEVTSSSFFATLYPVKDKFETLISGEQRLPIRYIFLQHEGFRRNRKQTHYDQENLQVTYRKNKKPPQTFQVEEPVHNEFSSFLILRTLMFDSEDPIIVPTFADKKSHHVQVINHGPETLKTMFGEIRTIKVEPRLTFKGLYEKTGSVMIWLTDDKYRIPVRIKSKITIGALTAELYDYYRPGETPYSRKKTSP